MMKTEVGENGVVCYCTKCHVFFLLILQEKYLFKHRDCYDFELAEFCQNCGELYNDDSICCYKAGYLSFIKFVYSFFYIDSSYYYIMLPFISLVGGLSKICNIILSIRKKGDNINFVKDINCTAKVSNMCIIILYIFNNIFLSFYSILLFFLMVSIKNKKRKGL